MSAYFPLWCKSNGSFLEGASFPQELVETARHLGLPGLALTDRDGLYGIVPAFVRACELEVQLVTGAQVTVDELGMVLLLAASEEGYRNLCRLISQGRLRSPKGSSRVTVGEVCRHHEGLLCLLIPSQERLLHPLQKHFGDRLYGMIPRHRRESEVAQEKRWRELASLSALPLVAVREVLYHERERQSLQDVLTCIREGVTLATAGRRIRPNAEHALCSGEEFLELFKDHPDEIARTLEIAERCRFSMSQLRYRYPIDRTRMGEMSPQDWLEHLTWEGARKRYPEGISPAVREQLKKELDLILELDYGGYFLTMYDIVTFCREKGILCQGRGSAANSAVCYCLGITAVDPIKMGLLFERFLSRERSEPPDIDLDIAHQRREEVIQHVYQVYGRNRAAMVANLVRYRPRSAVRDIGKVLGLEALELERWASLLSYWDENLPEERLREVGLNLDNPLHRHLISLTHQIMGFPRHLSIHPGGFLLGHEPVCDLVPIENARMENRTVIQWDKRDIESLGLFKVDLLGLGALSHVDRCFQLIERHRGVHLSMATLPEDDVATYDMLCKGDTVGVFQIESRAQMSMLPRLKPRCYYDLVIEVSIVRPGPITGGMVHPYLRRRNGEEEITYPHPCLEPILKKTLGIPLFQEQVIRLAMVAADYTPGEADQLRRDMGAWKSSGQIEKHREKLILRMVAKGIAREFAERVFEQIRGFGEYGFPESHAASFALISYATAYLKCHYPAEFTCALLNSLPMGFYSALTVIQDARRHGVLFLPLDVQTSQWECTMEDGRVRMGLSFVKGLSQNDGENIVAARQRGGPFAHLEELARRARLDRQAARCLARSGALACWGGERRAHLWTVAGLSRHEWVEPEPRPQLPSLTELQDISWDCKYSSHSLKGHPLAALRYQLSELGLPDARTLNQKPDRSKVRFAGMVICRQRPETARGITFFTLEDETGLVNVVVKPELMEKHFVLSRTASLLGVAGRLESRHEVVHVLAEELFEPLLRERAQPMASRDFH